MTAVEQAVKLEFKRAERKDEFVRIGLAGGTGSGKTDTAFKLATGMSGGKPFAVIDADGRRALHYANDYVFDHADLMPPFRPDTYKAAILAAEAARYPVIVIDTMSQVWEGDGGVIEWQEEELERMAGDDWKKRESCKMAAWIKPKTSHKKMVQKLLQVRAHLIICFRAEEKIEMVRNDKGKMEIVPKQTLTGLNGWVPICEKRFPFELTTSILMTNDAPGFPKPIKLEGQHRSMFPLDRPITSESGRLLAEWAKGAPADKPVEMPDIPSMIKAYAAATDTAAWEALEAARAKVWSRIPPSEQKTALKAASDAAKARLSTGAAE